jgi:GNAT superfamily N-acetyltransferase
LASHEPPGGFAAGVFDGDDLIAVGLIGPQGGPGDWRIRGMATVAHARGRGAGSAVLTALLDHAAAEGGRRAWCNVRVNARWFYERAGFRVSSDEFDLPEIGPHLVMERPLVARP